VTDRVEVASVRAVVADRLRAMIHAGDIEAGGRLGIAELADRFGVSRTPVRDALGDLSVEGLVEIVPRVGVFARLIDAQEVRDVYALKHALEPVMAAWGAARGTAAERLQFRESVSQLRTAAEAGDVGRYVSLLEDRRVALLQMSRSQVLTDVLGSIDSRVRLLRWKNLSQPGHLLRSVVQHEQIAEAVGRGDPDAAASAMADHMADSALRIAPLLEPEAADEAQLGQAEDGDGAASSRRASARGLTDSVAGTQVRTDSGKGKLR
jgi:GntR family transcriptional regulator, rspAB operon transcriptional repressor